MPHLTTLSAHDLERMRASVSPPVESDREVRRQVIKVKSAQRTATWPNTLEATRRKKDRWKKDKEERLEEERKKIDEEELRLQREAQTKQIERASRLIYEQTDRMKTLRSKQLLADVVHLEEKQMLKDEDEVTNYNYDQQVLAKVVEENDKELREKRQKLEENARLAASQRAQLDEYKTRYMNELREEKENGDRMKQQAEQEYRDEMEKERQRKLRLKQANEETQLANQRLRVDKEKQKEKERLEDTKRDEEERRKQLRDAKRLNLERQKKESAQARRQRIIELAMNNLVKLEQQNDERLNNQQQEVRLKEEKERKDQATWRATEKDAIARSRLHQLECKQREKAREAQEALDAITQWEEFERRLESQVKQEVEEQRMEDIRLVIDQKLQADARRKMIVDEKSTKRQDSDDARRALAYENDRFKQVAQQALDDARKRGLTNVFPIQKAIVEKRIELLHASGFRV